MATFQVIAKDEKIKKLPCSKSKDCSIGVYGESPENKSGSMLIYVELDTEKRDGSVLVYDNKNNKIIEKVYLKKVDPHNSARQYWDNDYRIVYQDGYQDIYIYDLQKKTIIKHLNGKLGLKNKPGTILIKKDRKNNDEEEPGIYKYNIELDSELFLISYNEIESFICEKKIDCTLLDIWNIKIDQSNENVFARVDYKLGHQKHKRLLIISSSYRLTDIRLPIHFFIDNGNVLGSYDGRLIALDPKFNLVKESDLFVNHFDKYNNKIATDNAYFSKKVNLKLCDWQTVQCEKIFESENSKMVWANYFHINPAFNFKNNKLFFNYPVDNYKVTVAYVEL